MDDIVRQAMAKWPNVPHCYGWLALDARGGWYMRDDRTQAAGAFPAQRGSLLRHEKLVEFIQRNFDHDPDGCWYFQNGPQRVYVELEAAPWILRIDSAGQLTSQTGRPATARASLVDELGRLFVDTEIGCGLVHTLDMHLAADLVEAGAWTPEPIESGQLAQRFRFVLSPQALRNEKAGH